MKKAHASANGTTKEVRLGGHHTVVGRLKYGGQLERAVLYRKFVKDVEDSENARWNFIVLSTQTFADPPCELAGSSDTPEEFERKLAGLLDLDNEDVERWIAAIGEVAMSQAERAQLPAEALTPEELRDPN